MACIWVPRDLNCKHLIGRLAWSEAVIGALNLNELHYLDFHISWHVLNIDTVSNCSVFVYNVSTRLLDQDFI